MPITYAGVRAFAADCADTFDALHYYAGLADPIGVFFGQACDELGVPLLNNRAHISSLVHDKMYQALCFTKAGLPTPRAEFTRTPDWKTLTQKLGVPLIAKRVRGTHGTHVHKITDAAQLAKITEPSSHVFQEFIPHTNDVRVLVLNGKAVCGYQRVPATDDFRANLAVGGAARSLESEQEKLTVFPIAEAAARVIGLELGGVDLIRDPNDAQYKLIEININPSWYGISALTDVLFEDALLDVYEAQANSLTKN
jgi:RimK family alpha-L-glutamate ligase